jgi:hypothetical protein
MRNGSLEKKDNQSCRVWAFPKDEWKQIKSSLAKNKMIPDSKKWQNEKWENVAGKDYKADVKEKVPHIYLTRAPLTFGQSQLVIPFPSFKNEKEVIPESYFFQIASLMIIGAYKAFEKVFKKKNPIHEWPMFKRLAESTYSYGEYIKTLVIRASADEEVGRQYKIHLAPYFQSHAAECLKRYRSLHKVCPSDRGGLIGWLGNKETEVEKWEVEWRWPEFSLDDVARDIWRLPDLAQQLSRVWPG